MTQGTDLGCAAHGAVDLSERPSGQANQTRRGRWSNRRRWLPIIACGVGYLVLSLIDFGHLNDLGSAHIAGAGGADQIIQVWWIGWAEHALAQGHNPFFSNWINYPVGINSGPNGSMLAIGTLVSPITAIFGPVVSWNVLVRLTLWLSAFSMCFVLRRWTQWWPAAFVGGLLYGFCVYQTTLANGYVFLTFVPLPPLVFLLLYEGLVRQKWKPSCAGALLAVVGAAQFLVSSEIFTSTVLLGLIAVVLFLFADRRSFAPRWPYARTFGTWAIVLGGILLVVPVAFTLFGPQATNGAPNAAVAQLHGDLLGGIVPTYVQRFTTPTLTSFAANNLSGSSVLYLGLPFFLAVGGTVVWLRKRGIVALAGAMTAISFLLSLGSTLYIGGDDTHVPLPFLLLAHLPLVQGLAPQRFALFTCLFGGAVVAFGLEEVQRRWSVNPTSAAAVLPRRQRIKGLAVVVALAVIVVLPVLPLDAQLLVRTNLSPLFSSKSAATQIPTGSAVLAYPYPDSPVFPGAVGYSYLPRYQAINDPLLDQAAVGMPFKLIGSYGWRPAGSNANTAGPSPLAPASVQALFDFAFYGVATRSGQGKLLVTSNLVADLREFVQKQDVDTVVVLPVGQHPATVVKFLTAAIGEPSHVKGATVWFDVEHRLETVAPRASPSIVAAPPVTHVARPTSDEQLKGDQYLVASATASLGLKKVVFHITGQGRNLVEKAVTFPYGWLGSWNTSTVPNGRYTVHSVAYAVTGQVTISAGVVVRVKN